MKKIILGLSAITLIAFTSCEKKDAVAVSDAEEVAKASDEAATFNVDTDTSNVEWRGYKFYEAENKEEGHHGTVKLSSGSMNVEGGSVVAGDFIVDATSLESMDLNHKPKAKADLDAHLKDPDFLDVEKYPTASFKITDVKAAEGDYNSEVSGNFKMREIEKNITFKANINMEGDALTFSSEEFTINRQDFGIDFKGGKGSVIKDNITLRVNVNANKAGEANLEAVTDEPVKEELSH